MSLLVHVISGSAPTGSILTRSGALSPLLIVKSFVGLPPYVIVTDTISITGDSSVIGGSVSTGVCHPVGCVAPAKRPPYAHNETPPFASFRDIPGASATEIEAIEALQNKYPHFIYGMTPSTEAFLDE
ncbi:MAG: hypothetical protein FWG05_05070, partial [Kiritimatiellaeota bacterium]|nr:hypothetical protein [Kiritimatiellota bacterium]